MKKKPRNHFYISTQKKAAKNKHNTLHSRYFAAILRHLLFSEDEKNRKKYFCNVCAALVSATKIRPKQKLLHACWLGHFLLVQERELVLALAEAEAEAVAGHVKHQEKKLQS